jgi:hypothetical protein
MRSASTASPNCRAKAFSMYPGLTRGAAEAIQVGGSDEQKKIYLTNMMTGKWSGTMNLTEPQCGTDLGLIRTKAGSAADGTYKITGQKIWISAASRTSPRTSSSLCWRASRAGLKASRASRSSSCRSSS